MTLQKNWTVMIYMAGNNNLSVDMAYALEELQKKVAVDENDKMNLFVYYDNNSPDIPAIYCDFSDTNNPIFLNSSEVGVKFSNEHQTIRNNQKAINPLVDFVDWCVTKVEYVDGNKIKHGRKADNYALILSGHSMGFLSLGLFKDESTDTSMTMPALKKGLETIKESICGKRLALLGFDSCVMSMFEVGQEFETVAETMIASEGTIPNSGWSYAEILGSLSDKNTNINKVAETIVKKYIEKQANYSIGGVSVDMSAWDLSNLDDLNVKFGRLATNLLQCFEDQTSAIYGQMKRILLQVHYNSQTYMYEQCIDLGDFCSLLIEEIATVQYETKRYLNPKLLDVSESCKAILDEIKNCVILSGFSGGEYQFSTGISLFFPWSLSAYQVSMKDYESLHFVKNTISGRIWNDFLQKYLCVVNRRKSIDTVVQHPNYLNHEIVHQHKPRQYEHRVPVNPQARVPVNPQARVPVNPQARVPVNPQARVPVNPQARIGSDLIGNSSVKMSGNFGRFFENFNGFKNIESDWKTYGFTKDVS